MKSKQTGFTLIEIAIVLVIIGLLLGGVLKGQELINSARVKNLATDFRNIPVYIYGYQDRYRALPGDDATIGTANTHLAGGTACAPAAANKCAVGNGVIDGAWNNQDITTESYVFWQHVRLAGLAPGPTDTTLAPAAYLPTNSAGGFIGIQSNNANFTTITQNSAGAASLMTGSYIICSEGILGRFAAQLDVTMDDGNTDTGSMRTVDPAGGGKSVATATVNANPGQTYTVCMGI